MKLFLCLPLLFLVASCQRSEQVAAIGEEPIDVSMVQLIATPERFDRKHVRVVGYLHQAFESSGIYLHREDHEKSLFRNGVWLSGTCGRGQYSYNNRYVLIEAKFSSRGSGHMGLWSGELTDVGRCVPLPHKQSG